MRLNFTLPSGQPADAYFDGIAVKMVANGWTNGPPPGYETYGRVIHTKGVVGVMLQGLPTAGRTSNYWASAATWTTKRTTADSTGPSFRSPSLDFA